MSKDNLPEEQTPRTEEAPAAKSRASMLAFGRSTPIKVRGVPGCGWCPVMAVVELSTTIKSISWRL